MTFMGDIYKRQVLLATSFFIKNFKHTFKMSLSVKAINITFMSDSSIFLN